MSTEIGTYTPAAEAWSRILEDPRFEDLPYKVETNASGQIILSPHKSDHSYRQGDLMRLLAVHLPNGRIAAELAIQTSGGIKVPDVTWASHERYASTKAADPPSVAPELVIEVLSASNTRREMEEKRGFYFAAGAREVWTCDPQGRMAFYDDSGEISRSTLVPAFPASIP